MKTLRVRDGELLVTDGPFTETKETRGERPRPGRRAPHRGDRGPELERAFLLERLHGRA